MGERANKGRTVGHYEILEVISERVERGDGLIGCEISGRSETEVHLFLII